MHSRILMFTALIASLVVSDIMALPGTLGTPLGGIGTGYVKFNAKKGVFAASDRFSPGAGSMKSEFSNKQSSSSGFYFYAGGKSAEKVKTDNEDAKCPLYTATFDKVNNVEFKLNAFGPVIPGDDGKGLNIQLATSPAAMFEITAKNTGSSAMDVAVALEFVNKSSSVNGLLGGENTAKVDSKKGITYPTAEFNDLSSSNKAKNTGNAYMLVDCSSDDAEFSSGAKGDFLEKGVLSNEDGNFVGAKCKIEAGKSVKFKFVLAWWRTFVSEQDRYKTGKNDADNFFYHNYYKDSKEVAEFCMENFDYVRNGIVSMVDRTMASNFPDWYKDRLFNNTYPLIHNSVWTKDGRAAYWEGKYAILGTIDQGQHAAIWYVHNWPKNQWAELNYWLRDAFQSKGYEGQIHHDFNIAPANGFSPPEARFMTPWDNWDRNDYWFQPNTKEWSDLNSMAIFKAYELMLVTGNKDSLKANFERLKTTANRLVKMSEESGFAIPLKSKSTYDSDGDLTPQYACGVAIAAYKAMEEMAKFLGDSETEEKYKNMYEEARKDYKEELYNDKYGATIDKQGWNEGHVGGYSWANYLGMSPIQDKEFIEKGCNTAFKIYSGYSDLKKKVGGWHYYTYDHLGGALTAIGRPDDAMQIHEWDYELCYEGYPDLVFWQELFSNNVKASNYPSYMTGPNIWRSYFQFMGYLLDNANNRLFVRPNLPSEMENQIKKAALPNPYGWGTLDYNGNVKEVTKGGTKAKMFQEINVTYDNPVKIKEIILKNNTGLDKPFVTVWANNTEQKDFKTTFEDFDVEKNIIVTLDEPVSTEGICIGVYDKEVGIVKGAKRAQNFALKIVSSSISAGKPIICSIKEPGNVTVELMSLNGKKIATLVNRNVSTAGNHSFFWNGKTTDGKTIGTSAGVLRLSTKSGTVSKVVLNMSK